MNDLFDSGIEESLLTTILLRPDLSHNLLRLRDEDFYLTRNKYIFRAARTLTERGLETGFMACKSELISTKNFEQVSDEYMGRLMGLHPDVRGLDRAIERLLDFSMRRKLIDAYQRGMDATHDMRSTADIIHDVDSMTSKIITGEASGKVQVGFQGEGLDRFAGRFLRTGFSPYDMMFKGFSPGNLVILAARTGEGKTTFALQIAKGFSTRVPVYFYSLEMTGLEIELKLISLLSGIDSMKIQSNTLDEWEVDRYNKFEKELPEYKIHIWDNITDIGDIVSTARRGKEKPGLIIVDYIQLVQSRDRERRDIQIGEITGSLKRLAAQLGIPVLALSQLSRQAENETPKLSHLRESGNIEQDANQVLFIYKNTSGTFLNVAKYRMGKVGILEVMFNKECNRFEQLYADHSTTYEYEQN